MQQRITPLKPPITVRLASPRGFCAGVERAIRTVEEALALHGAPVYVRHEIVHNIHAAARKLIKIDATCPLVLKVHSQIRRYAAAGRTTILIGHANHPEVIGAIGQARDGAVLLVETLDDIAALADFDCALAYATQTTLSVDETHQMIAALKQRFPDIAGPAREDICYATSNRQQAVKATAHDADLFLVIGSPTSSNSVRLVETARIAGAAKASLMEDATTADWSLIDEAKTIGLSAGASAPETLVEEFLTALAARRTVRIETIETARENIVFNTPQRLAS